MINYFNFKEFRDKFLLTNDAGRYHFVDRETLRNMISGNEIEEPVRSGLISDYFIFDEDPEVFIEKMKYPVRDNKRYLFGATSLHIFVLNNACNLCCVYCQAKDDDSMIPQYMDEETARKCVDIALQSPARNLSFEFQGGEPLLNFDILRVIVEYAEEKKGTKNISYNVVTNLTLLNLGKLNFLMEYNINICTSLDGDKLLHDSNRVFKDGSGTFELVRSKMEWVRNQGHRVNAIQTTTRNSLTKYKEIIDAYLNVGQHELFIRPLTRLGTADKDWEEIGYSADEFVEFYRNCMDYILELNKSGTFIREKHAVIFLEKILAGTSSNYMELRSPCGASVGQLAYFYDGSVYTCDEGRMLSEMGDPSFKLGSVYDDDYSSLMQSDVCRTVCIASLLEGQLNCCDCVYQPYCGVCPVITLAQENDLFSKDIKNYRCTVYKGMLDYLFEKLYENDEDTVKILKSWIGAVL